METPAPAPAPAPTPAPLLDCRLCNIPFETVKEKRQHAKSEWHVYRIRCRVAEPGTIVPPPDNEHDIPSSIKQRKHAMSQEDECSYDDESEGDSLPDKDTIGFVAEQCLFCNQISDDFNQNLSHMHQTHSLVIPFQSSLAVDFQTLIWFLHMIIFSYRECICCGKRRRTIEAVQQHMTSMGHCRFNVTGEMSELYHMDSLDQWPSEIDSHLEGHTLRLPSGKLLTHRSHIDSTSRSRLRSRLAADPSALPAPQQHEDAEAQALTKGDEKQQALTTQISQLRKGDQTSLMHLPESQQRALLVAHKKELDKAKRAERRQRGRMDNVGNKTTVLTNYYKQEVPVYMGG